MQQQDGMSISSSGVTFCPSFNAYTSDKVVDIAARVSREFKAEKSNSEALLEEVDEENDDGDDFEFVCIGKNLDASELFFDGQIHQVFPVFNRDLLLNDGDYSRSINREDEQTQFKLFVDNDQAGPPSPSLSSSDEEHHTIFCIWSSRKNPIESSPSRCKKSNSTGSSSSPSSSSSSSKKWQKLLNLLKRNNSDGKDSFVFLSKPKRNPEKEKKYSKEVKSGEAVSPVSAHKAFYVKTRANKEGNKKRSYLPYRQDLVGLFTSYPHGHSIGKTYPSV